MVAFYNGARMLSGESTLRRADRFSTYRIDNEWALPDQVSFTWRYMSRSTMYSAVQNGGGLEQVKHKSSHYI